MKKIFVMGKTYDLSDLKEVEKDVTERLRDYTQKNLNFRLTTPPGFVLMTWDREVLPDYTLEVGSLLEADILMVLGNGYEGFQPKYDCLCFSHFPGITNLIDKEDFIKCYIENCKYYGATKPKKVEVEETRTKLTVKIEYPVSGKKVQKTGKP